MGRRRQSSRCSSKGTWRGASAATAGSSRWRISAAFTQPLWERMERSLWAEGGLIKAPRTTIVQARGSYRYQNERTVTAAVRAGITSAGKMTHSCSTESTGMTRSKDSSRTFLNHARREHVHQDDPFSFLDRKFVV